MPSKGVSALRAARGANAEPPNRVIYVSADQLHPSPLNPRRRERDDEAMDRLMNSIARLGLLENLVVREMPLPNNYEIVCGSRRHEAVERLLAAGRIAPDFEVPVLVRRDIDDVVLVEMALAENIQREDLTPLEQADSFAWLVDHGVDPETIAANIDRSLRYVRRGLALHRLLDASAKRALDEGKITLGQAAALTLGDKPRQEELMARILAQPAAYPPAKIRSTLTERAWPLSRAKFAHELYRGKKSEPDLFEDDEVYCYDTLEFRRLQLAWCRARAADLGALWSWVEVLEGGWYPEWDFLPGVDGAPAQAGVLIHLRDNGLVEEHTGKVRRADLATGAEPARPPGSPPGAQPWGSALGAPRRRPAPDPAAHIRWAQEEKERRLQVAVAEDLEAALAQMILSLLGCREGLVDGFSVPPIENPALAARVARWRARIGAEGEWDAAAVWDAVWALDGSDRAELFALLVAAHCGDPGVAWGWDGAAPGDGPLAVAVAAALGVSVPVGWRLSADYLERLPQPRLLLVAQQSGCRMSRLVGLPAGEMIDQILLDDARDERWIPPELRFGATAELEAALAAQAPPATGHRP